MFTYSIQLVQEAQLGEPAAREEIAGKLYQDILDWSLHKIFPSYQDAKEFANWTAWKIVRSLPNFQWKAKFSSWAWSIVVRERANFFRNPKLMALPIDDSILEVVDPRPLDAIEELEQDIFLEQVLAKNKYEVFTLSYEGMTDQEISERLDIPLGTVKTRLKSSRVELQRRV